ncbi:MAG: hypothetical protein AB1635_03945 [Acidobacteriota bacterium]
MTITPRVHGSGRRLSRPALAVAAVVVCAQVASAQGPIRNLPTLLQPIGPRAMVVEPILDERGAFTRLPTNTRGMIYGIVQNHLGELVPNAGTVQIRNLLTGEIVGQAEVNELAQFTLRGFDPGMYSAELVGQSGTIIATSGAFTASVGEVIQLAPVIPAAPLSGLANFASTATTSTVTSAAGSGVLAVEPGRPISPGR